MQPQLSKAAAQLRGQVDDCFADRDRRSDGTTGDPRHAVRKSDHNPDAQGWVRAWDCDADLHKGGKPDVMSDLVDQIRLLCKSGVEKRISYIIYDSKIYSSILNWKPRKYTGANKHTHHAHFSFKKEADNDGSFFQVPMLGASNE
jgi:hypothetical protein